MARNRIALTLFSFVLLAGLSPPTNAQSLAENPATPPPPHEKQVPAVEKNLRLFDTLDFDVFSNQKWDRLKESHAQNIKVYWPDGHVTEGINVHIEDLKKLFIHAPDTRIKEHPIKFGSGNYTLVTGVFEGTFTKPMPIGDGKFIPPTGKAFKMPMATVGIWENGVMKEEHLFWDNQTYMNQMGLGK